jgi:hypothetical protein
MTDQDAHSGADGDSVKTVITPCFGMRNFFELKTDKNDWIREEL